MVFVNGNLIVVRIDEHGNTIQEVLANVSGSEITFSYPVTFENGIVSSGVDVNSGFVSTSGGTVSGTLLLNDGSPAVSNINLQTAVDGLVSLSGNQTISGVKSFIDGFNIGGGGLVGNNLLQINAAGNVPTSIAGVSSILELDSEDANQSDFQFRLSTDSAGAPAILLSRSRGTLGAPTAVTSGMWVGSNLYLAYNGFSWGWAAKFDAYIDGPVASGSNPGRLSWSTTPSGSAFPTERMRIDSAGDLTVYKLTPNRVLTTDSLKRLTSSSVSDAELLALSGVQSNIQAQLDSKAPSSISGTLVGQFQAADTSLSGVLVSYTDTKSAAAVTSGSASLTSASGTLQTDINNRALTSYVNSQDTTLSGLINQRLTLSGGTLTGALTLSGNPTLPNHAATKQYVDTASVTTYSGVSATADNPVTSTSYAQVNSMTMQPPSGIYSVSFSASMACSNNNADVVYGIHNAGTLVAESERQLITTGGSQFGNTDFCVHSQAIISVNGSQIIDVKVKSNAGTVTTHERSLIAIKIA